MRLRIQPRTYLLVSITLMVIALLIVLGLSFTKEKADVAKSLLLFGVSLVSAIIGYALAVCDRHEMIAKVGRRELRMQLSEPDDDKLGPDLEAELHDFACHVLRHREVPEWRKAVVSASLPKLEEPAAPRPAPPSPADRATDSPKNPPGQRPAAAICENCASVGAKKVRMPGTITDFVLCPTCEREYVQQDSPQPVP